MSRPFLKQCLWLLVWGCCWQACRPVPQKSPVLGDRLVQPLDFEYLKLGASILCVTDEHQYSSAYIRFRIHKDQCIWFSVSVAWGVEVMRGMVTPKDITLVNHIQQVYHVYDYAALGTAGAGPWDYALLQAVLLGELTRAYTAQEVIQEDAQQAMIQQHKAPWVINHLVNPALGKVEKLVASTLSGKLIAVYDQFKPYPGGLLFRQAKVHWYPCPAPAAPTLQVTLRRAKARWPKKPLSFPFSIPKHYEKK